MSQHYLARVGLNWPPGVRREAGADVSDMPPGSIPHELAAGHIVAYAPEPHPAADAAAHRTAPLPALPDEEA